MVKNVNNLPGSLRFRITYEKSTDTLYAQCLTNPNIHTITSGIDISRLLNSLNAVVYDQYGVNKAYAKKIGNLYTNVIISTNPITRILSKIKEEINDTKITKDIDIASPSSFSSYIFQ